MSEKYYSGTSPPRRDDTQGHLLGWGVLRNLSPGWMVLRHLSSDWTLGPLLRLGETRDLYTGLTVLGDHSLYLGILGTSQQAEEFLGDLSLDWGDLRDLSTGWGVLGDLSFDWCFLWDPSLELDRDLGISWNLTWDCGLFW